MFESTKVRITKVWKWEKIKTIDQNYNNWSKLQVIEIILIDRNYNNWSKLQMTVIKNDWNYKWSKSDMIKNIFVWKSVNDRNGIKAKALYYKNS